MTHPQPTQGRSWQADCSSTVPYHRSRDGAPVLHLLLRRLHPGTAADQRPAPSLAVEKQGAPSMGSSCAGLRPQEPLCQHGLADLPAAHPDTGRIVFLLLPIRIDCPCLRWRLHLPSLRSRVGTSHRDGKVVERAGGTTRPTTRQGGSGVGGRPVSNTVEHGPKCLSIC